MQPTAATQKDRHLQCTGRSAVQVTQTRPIGQHVSCSLLTMIQVTSRSNPWLLAAAISNFIVAGLHVMIVLSGPLGYLFFGTAELARLAAQGSTLPAKLTLLLAIVFIVFGFHALSETGRGHRLPFSRLIVFCVATLYTLRGLILLPDLIRLMTNAGYPLRQIVFSAFSLTIGVVHFKGLVESIRSHARFP